MLLSTRREWESFVCGFFCKCCPNSGYNRVERCLSACICGVLCHVKLLASTVFENICFPVFLHKLTCISRENWSCVEIPSSQNSDKAARPVIVQPFSLKVSTIRTLTRRAQLVCDSPDSLQDETDYLTSVLIIPRTTREMVTSTIRLLNTIYRRNIKSTGTLQHVLRIPQTTINDLLLKAGLLTWNKRHWIEANSYQHRTNDLLTRQSRTNYERTDNFTNNRRLFNCDNRRIETHQLLITSLHSHNITA